MKTLFIVAIAINAVAFCMSLVIHNWVTLAINTSMLALLFVIMPRGTQ